MKAKQYIKEINQYSEHLSPEYKNKFNELLLKIRFSNVREKEAEEFSHHCLDLFLQANEQNIPVEQLLGTDDLNEFCKDFINESINSYSTFEKWYLKINHIPLILLIYTGISEMLLCYLIPKWIKGNMVVTVPITISICLNTLMTILLCNFLTSKISFFYHIFSGNDKKRDRKITFFLWLLFVAFLLFAIVTGKFLTAIIFNLNYFIFIGTLLIIWILLYIFENYNEKR